MPIRTLSPETERTVISMSVSDRDALVGLPGQYEHGSPDLWPGWNGLVARPPRRSRGLDLSERGFLRPSPTGTGTGVSGPRWVDSRAAMAGKPLRSQLNQIRAWVREGRTDAWIAHQLDISASELREFRRRHDLTPDSEPDTSDDLRDEIEAEVEAATLAAAEAAEESDEEVEDDEEAEERGPRGPRGGRRTSPAPTPAPRRSRPQARRCHRDRCDLRPRRGRRLRPLARSGGQGQPGLRRQLGRPSRRPGDDRGGSDHDPPRRQRRLTGREGAARRPRRLTAEGRSCAWISPLRPCRCRSAAPSASSAPSRRAQPPSPRQAG